jgi:hypothetical protein
MPRAGDKKRYSNTAFTAYMALLGDSRWVSRRALYLWLKSPNKRSELIRGMQDEGYITCINMNEKIREKRRREKKKIRDAGLIPQKEVIDDVPSYIYGLRYGLSEKGREYLRANNEKKYGQDALSMQMSGDYNSRRMYRLSLLSEIRAMSELAGFCVHPHQKPPATVLSGHPLKRAAGPAFSAFTTPKPLPARKNDIDNRNSFQYYETKTKRSRYGYKHYDAKPYVCRTTPIGCVYLLPELIALADAEAEEVEGLDTKGNETDRMRYSRLAGLLFTGNGSYRLYCTERTAPRLRPNGERNMKTYLDAWTAHVYGDSLTELITNPDNPDGDPEETPISGMPEVAGSILFGDYTHAAAISVLEHTFSEFSRKAKGRERGFLNYNLRTIKDTYYMPVIREALPLYSTFIFPHWPTVTKAVGIEYLGTLAERSEAPAPFLVKQYFGDYQADGLMSDGSLLLSLAALHLDAIEQMISALRKEQDRFTVAAMEWQKPFYDAILEILPAEDAKRVSVFYMPQSYLETWVKSIHEIYGNFYGG